MDTNEINDNEKVNPKIAQDELGPRDDRFDKGDEAWFFKMRNIIYYVLGVIEVLLAFRLIFRSLGANANNLLVASLYSLTRALTAPFSGIFSIIVPSGLRGSVIEPATVIAMVVYALLAYGIIRLIKVTALDVRG